MKRFPIILICLMAASTLRADVFRVLSWDAGGVTVEFRSDEPRIEPLESEGEARLCRVELPGFFSLGVAEGDPVLPIRRLLFAIPTLEGVRLDIIEAESYQIDGFIPAPYLPDGTIEERKRSSLEKGTAETGEFVRLVDTGLYRKRPIAVVEVSPVLFDPTGPRLLHATRIVARISFPPVRRASRPLRSWTPFSGAVVNSEQASTWDLPLPEMSALQRTPFEFSLSDDWVKIRINEKGIYIITYNDFISAGINPSLIDPSTVRLFGTPPYPEPDSVDSGGSFAEEYHLTEHALLYRGAASTQFMPNDTLFFYALGVDAWEDDIDPNLSHRRHVEHPYESRNVYWLTWGGSFEAPPERMDERSVPPDVSYDHEITSYEERRHIEQDISHDPIYTDDRWYWQTIDPEISNSFTNTIYLDEVVGSEGAIRTQAYGPYVSLSNENVANYQLNGSYIGFLFWFVSFSYNPENMPILEADVSNIAEGYNTLVISKTSGDKMYVLWYEVFYQRRLRAVSGSLDFYALQETGLAHYSLDGYQNGSLYLFDVTSHSSPIVLAEWDRTAEGVEFVDVLEDPPRHYISLHASSLRHPALEPSSVQSLRDDPVCPDMLVIHHERFSEAASLLRSLRAEGIPYAPNPYVKAVDIDAVYDNFSGGRKDPVAIRNYLKFLYDSFTDGGEPVLKYVLLIGNGTYDTKDILSRGNDFLPLYMNRYYYQSEAVEDDDYYVRLDYGYDNYPDIAIGRLSVLNEREANSWADRIARYGGNIDLGSWRNEVILVADDEFGSSFSDEFYFMIDAEAMCADDGQFPRFIDFKKVYLHDYPKVGISKPAARRALLDSWSDGALIVNYAGHGSAYQMADEYVMEDSDIYTLTNENERPLMLSFSCTTGDLASPYRRSLSQIMCTYDGGGAIATMSSTGMSLGYQNGFLNAEVFRALFTSKDSTGTEPVGYAFIIAKSRSAYIANNAKYVLLGDPAMKLALPAYTIEHEVSSVDTLYTGHGYSVQGSVIAGGQVHTSFNGTADLIVQEAEKHFKEITSINITKSPPDTTWLEYSLPGKELFRGSADVTGGQFALDFVVPMSCRIGHDARVRSYVMSSSIDGVGACDTLVILQTDTIPENEESPSVHLYFANQATKVKAGARLIGEISDPDGIAILGTSPQNSIYLEFDYSGFPIFVTENFEYDHGSSTKGSIEYSLQSGFSPGPHSVILKAFDNLGISSTDTLRFEIIEEGLYTVSDVFNFPNPFKDGTNFVFQLSNPAEVCLSVYTVSGIKIWEIRNYAEEGFNSIYWDGRDLAGDRPANGTYLYFLDVEFQESFHRKESAKGKVVLLR
jgi:hypothetical protein